MSLRYEPPPQMPISDKEKTDWIWRKWIFGFYKKIDVQEAWIAPTLLNSWVNFGSGFNDAGYMKDSLGFVHLRGLVKDGVLSSNDIFILPASYRPANQAINITISNNLIGRVDIATDGGIQAVSGDNAWVTLDGITFKAA